MMIPFAPPALFIFRAHGPFITMQWSNAKRALLASQIDVNRAQGRSGRFRFQAEAFALT